ncbi:MAG: hypothetical protein HON90_14015 [Halobacteriovoraceae bacterium]|jgi:hypothetical protein|nr:hypothetical protein [Halobacteriovoraceae bacterium]
MRVFFLLLILLSCEKDKGSITIVKQWHLSPDAVTTDIANSKNIQQYENQFDIYQKLKKDIESKETKVIIAEGCEGELDENFSLVYNGWSFKNLKKLVNDKKFDEIMAPVPLKLKVKFPKIRVLCGDNNLLIDENLKAISDVRGFTGFYQRLVESKNTDLAKFKKYKQQLVSLFPKEKIQDPIKFSLEKAILALDRFEELIKKRNQSFVDLALKYKDQKPVIIIGGLHIKNLEQRFHIKNVKYNVITPKGYANDEQKLLYAMKEILLEARKVGLTYFQVPAKFNILNFPVKNKLIAKNIMTDKEKVELIKLSKGQFNFDILLSDFDKDGIRDFTVSASDTGIVLSAEDPDWDNDGIDNLIDPSVGSTEVGFLGPDSEVDNSYYSKGSTLKIKSELKQKVSLLELKGSRHELLVLEIFLNLLKKRSFKHVKFLVAAKPSFSYGENVFFSYIRQTQSLEYYPEKLNQYIQRQFQKRFRGVAFVKYIEAYVIPLVIHSLTHELAHSLDYDFESMAKKSGWSWQEKAYTGKYLKQARVLNKIIHTSKYNLKFRQKTYQQWNDDNRLYLADVNKILSIKNEKKRKAQLHSSHFKTNIKDGVIEHELSFLFNNNIPSLYALLKPSEWFAESYAACLFVLYFPESKADVRAIELEHLLGFNPKGVANNFCRKLVHQ